VKIAFVGVGVMGSSMVANLLKNGHEVNVYSRTKSRCDGVVALGAVWTRSVAECVRGCGIVITIVGYPKDVEEVYFGPYGAIANADAGAILIDMTTSSPKLARRIYAAAKERNLSALDAPV
jgi:3-hydroxyisobutyrate dehydrogenase-like beta-hydroxyacid dehydrogenase